MLAAAAALALFTASWKQTGHASLTAPGSSFPGPLAGTGTPEREADSEPSTKQFQHASFRLSALSSPTFISTSPSPVAAVQASPCGTGRRPPGHVGQRCFTWVGL
jgi:hypothetical protein